MCIEAQTPKLNFKDENVRMIWFFNHNSHFRGSEFLLPCTLETPKIQPFETEENTKRVTKITSLFQSGRGFLEIIHMDQWPHMAIHPPNCWKLSQATIRFFTEVLHVKPLLTLDDWTQICQVFSEKGDGSQMFSGRKLEKSQQLRLGGSCEYPTIQFR